ncbi:complement C3-like [Clarias gariepinus]|uniref:complement C3-like n=1 Tax=Clarias gariepinus TaxID=13013 RepID=UPI00234DC6DA|nr:complement C3-like [Clarias gariepinus]
MYVNVVWMMAAILSYPMLTLCDPLNVLVAPNLLRVGTPERVFVEAQDYSGNDLNVKITVKNHPQKTTELTSVSVILTAGNNYQAVVDITIPDNNNFFSDNPLEKQYVYLQAQFPSVLLEKMALVSFQSGYIFVQTDKSIYTPKNSRIFSLTPDLQPFDQTGGIYVEIINPQGIVISRETLFPMQGIITAFYNIPEFAKPGIWSIVMRYKTTPQKNFTAEFEVKDYVLPSFEVTLKPSKSFFYVDDQELQVDIIVKGRLGKHVDGVAFVVFGVMRDDAKTLLSASLKREQIIHGEGRAVLTREMIHHSFSDIADLVGNSIYISVSYLTESGSEMVKAERRGIKIVKSLYNIQFKRSPKFFKPGMSFDVMVYVTNPDQSPAENVNVVVTPGDVRGRTMNNGMAKVTVNTQGGVRTLIITAKSTAPGILPERQAVNQMTAQAYTTKGGSTNYLHISVDTAELTIGDQMKINLYFKSSAQNQDFTYLIISKGQIVRGERFKRHGQSLVTLSLPVTKDLLPSFRVVGYYHVGSSEVVSDSIWVHVKDSCMGTLKLDVRESLKVKKVFEPGDEFHLIVTGDPKAKVGLVAVDKAVFVLNKNRLTQTKIWDIIEKHDTGCTAGSGKDSMGVFYDAGLLFQSDKAGGTTERTALECSSPPQRKKRGESVLQSTATLWNYEDDDDEFISSDEIVSRTQFPESWLWVDTELPGCRGNIPCDTISLTLDRAYLKDTITTWQVLAISLSKTHGICVSDPYEIPVAKAFFVDLKLPSSAVRNEQVEIKAILHNFSNRKQRVRVEFFETEHVCSAASKKKKYCTIVNIDAKSSRAIPYVITPIELGNHEIEVQAASATFHDGVRRTLKVVSEGVLTELTKLHLEINPSKVPGGVQVVHYKSDIPNGRVPNSPAHTYITVTVVRDHQNVHLEMELSGIRSYPIRWLFTKNNAHLAHTEKVQLEQEINVTAKGSGAGVLKVYTLYYARPIEKKSECTKYDLSLEMRKEREVSYPNAEESYQVIIKLLFKDPNRDATMTVLDIALMTGFVVDVNDLTELTTGRDRYIQKFEINKQLSERGSLIIYLDKVSHTVPERIVFRVHKIFKVALPQPAAVSVYEYYSPENRCVKFYGTNMEQINGSINIMCYKEVCTCAMANCPQLKGPAVPEETVRSREACNKKEFIYKAILKTVTRSGLADVYTFTIVRVIKEGTDKSVLNEVRDFYTKVGCRDELALKEGKAYLIMAQEINLTGQSLRYTIDADAWLEYWPTQEEAQENMNNNKERYIALSDLAFKMELHGCTT